MAFKKELKEQDWVQIECYMTAGAKQKEIAQAFGMHPDTLRDQFEGRYGKNYHTVNEAFNRKGEMQIIDKQIEVALAGNPTMLIWLGKVRCKQRETDDAPKEAPNQSSIDLAHENMRLKNEIAELKAKLDAYIT